MGTYGLGGSVFIGEFKMYREEFKAQEAKSGPNGQLSKSANISEANTMKMKSLPSWTAYLQGININKPNNYRSN